MFDNDMAFGTLRDFMGDSDLLDALVKALSADEQRENFEYIARCYGEAVTAFADGEYPVNVLEAFNDYREDYVSSDREAAAFMMALQSRAMQPEPEPVTAEIPEVPPRTEPHEVVATSSAVMVRKAVIPGGKSVRELSDVFGAYAHKPRGFRDSKGRRVAYVVFDGTGGVVAYRDCYTDVDARLEEQIADYLAAHNLRLAA